MYIIVVRLKGSHSSLTRKLLANSGFAIYKIEKMTSIVEPVSEIEEPDDAITQETFFYECIYNGSVAPINLFDIFEKIEVEPSVINYSLKKCAQT